MNILDLQKFETIFSISDIHGNLPAFLHALKNAGLLDSNGDLNIDPKASIIINGDVFDYFYEKGIEDSDILQNDILKNKDWAHNILKKYKVDDAEIFALIDWLYGDRKELSYLSLLTQRISINKIRLEIVGALSVLELLNYLDVQKKSLPDRFFMLFGNHDLDFINGEWQYRSLQKNIVFSILKNNFIVQYQEFKDIKLNLSVITYNEHLLDQKKEWMAYGSKISKIFDERYCLALSKKSVYVHGGIPKEMLVECNNTDCDISKLKEILSKYSVKKAGSNSIFACDEKPDIPTSNVELTKVFLSKLRKKRLVVGHNPFLDMESDDPIDLSIESVDRAKAYSVYHLEYLVKSDTGIKYGNNRPAMYKEIL